MFPYPETLDGTPVFPLALGTTGTGTVANTRPDRDQHFVELFRRAFDLGINCFDTAEIYGGGYAETLLGVAFAPVRDSVFIVTKFNPGNATPRHLREAIEGSLTRLGCGYVDHFQLHWPNPFVPFEETWGELKRFLQERKIRSAGVGNCSMEELEEYWRISEGRITAVEIGFNAAEPGAEDELISWCRKRGVMVFAYSPLGQGKLAASGIDHSAVAKLCALHNCTIHGLLLAWVASIEGCIPVVRTGSLQHLEENYRAVSLKLTPEERMLVADAFCCQTSAVPLDSIWVAPMDGRGIYCSEAEALENRFEWIPSPALLAERIRRGQIPAPLRLRQDEAGSLHLDSYDYQGEMKKYWALRLAHGPSADVAAFVNRERS